MNWVIETRSLTKEYGPIRAVDDLSLQVPQGGVFGLLGPNGSGKTTTMGMLLGLVRATAGAIRLFGDPVEGVHPHALRRIGAIVEEPSFYPYLSGRNNLRYFQGIGGNGSRDEVDRLLETVGLAERAGSKFHTYSMGMKQRLGIAYALLGDPEVLFLDEPTNGLDPAGMAEIRDLIRELSGSGRTVLLSSHLLHEVEQVCDSVAILSRGRLIAQGNVQELLKGQGTVRLSTTDDAQAVGVLSALDWVVDVTMDQGGLVVTAPPERSPELTAALAHAGIYVGQMATVQVSLEEYFLEVTGGQQEPEAEGA
ncbi:MAG: ABC transporter ATP-binding protein [Dehalococcoidia bacterium]|nr:ABC transporter ATP-binding protein [Dehalococcoidia bacterium]